MNINYVNLRMKNVLINYLAKSLSWRLLSTQVQEWITTWRRLQILGCYHSAPAVIAT